MRGLERLIVGPMAVGMIAHVWFHFSPPWFGDVAYRFVEASLGLTLFCLASAARLLGPRRALEFFGIAVVLGYLAEYIGVKTGLLFGDYHYTEKIGPLVDGVAIIVAPVWFCIVYVTYVLSNLIVRRSPHAGAGFGGILWVALVGAFLTTAYDLVLDPFMVHKVGAWVIEGGSYFGETPRGLVGWMIVSFVIATVFRFVDRNRTSDSPAGLTRWAAAMPILAYAVWAAFFSAFGEPAGTRPIAFVGMGVGILAALSGLAAWQPSSSKESF